MDTLDLKEAAEYLKISEESARELAASGDLPGAKVGKAWVFLRDDLKDWLRDQVRRQQEQRQMAGDVSAQLASALNRANRRRPLPDLPETVSEIGSAKVSVTA